MALAAPDNDDGGAAPARDAHGHRCGTPQIAVAPVAPPPLRHGPGAQRIIHLNRRGGTYQVISGADTNSSTNVVSTRVSGPRTAVIAPLAADFDWDFISACVTEAFAPYNVRVVEAEPPPGTTYVEAVVGGNGTELGFGPNDLFGIAAADNFCGVTGTGIAFNFSETHRGVPERDAELCATIAHEVGHLLALEHEVLPTDLMSYVLVSDTTSKAFVNQASACGVAPGQTNPCSCSSGTTNSAMRLGTFVGGRATETNLPTIELVSPGADGAVAPLFTVEAAASDGEGMADVLVYLDGVQVGFDDSPEGDRYFIAVNDATLGGHMLGVVARDLAGNTARVDLPITVALLGNGEDCTNDLQCAGSLCAFTGDTGFCTQVCDPAGDECGAGFDCAPAGDLDVCVAIPEDEGGCCSTGGSSGPRAGTLLLCLAVAVGTLRRRRATAR